MMYQFRVYLYAAVILGATAFLYFWHYKPMGELEEAKKEIEAKELIIDLGKHDKEKAVFEAKQQAKKETLQDQKKEVHDEINSSVGHHIIWIR
ncbi:MAG TPA: hypothetical protein CFH81_08845 [Sulfurovum sp. UBA12169]|nr:MAG TPA: hypothetical protein CFH81_08845 [Sulfurovum sp. UBA12169]